MKLSLKRLNFYLTYLRLRLASLCYSFRRHNSREQYGSVPLSRDKAYVCQHSACFFHALMPNLVPQFNGASCSVASVATVLNTACFLSQKKGKKGPITQAEILDTVDVVHWKERVSSKGYSGRRGLPIEILGLAVEGSLKAFNIPYERVDVVALHPEMPEIGKRMEELKQRLVKFEKIKDTFLIAHFNQGIFTGGIHLPHISPVGAYDDEKNRVLILDVDPEQAEPYWVSFETFFEGLSWGYHGILKRFGYIGGGYVWIRLKPDNAATSL
ncbi:MAG: phytochelatin synthase [Deltaproteobacteria bacterium]|nr:phytochelatin synthase [Deltaproteobacteria bacterium]